MSTKLERFKKKNRALENYGKMTEEDRVNSTKGIVIRNNGPMTEVEINGVRVENVTFIQYTHEAGKLPEFKITVCPDETTFSSVMTYEKF